MPEIEIYFAGLICHVGPSDTEGSDRTTLVTSILIPDSNHFPRIRTRAGIAQDLNTGVTFTNLGSIATARSLFSDTVPHLDDLTRSGVKFKPTASGLRVQLPAGDFTVVQFYKYGAKWVLEGDENIRPCVPRVTMLKAKGDDVSVTFNGQLVPLTSDGWVLISNLEKAPSTTPGEDWKKQYTVTTGTADDIAVYYDLKPPPGTVLDYPCKRHEESGTYTAEVLPFIVPIVDSSECTNSHWP